MTARVPNAEREAEASLERARRELEQALAAFERAKLGVSRAEHALHIARVSADRELPEVVVRRVSWRGTSLPTFGVQDIRRVVRVTPGGSLVVRREGRRGEDAQFRRQERPGGQVEWVFRPGGAKSSMGDRHVIEALPVDPDRKA